MNDHDLITAVRDSFTDVHSHTPVERIVTRSRAVRARRRIPALAAALAGTAAAVVAVTSLLPGPQAGGGLTAAHSLRARLLAAIDAARGDVLSAQGRPSGPGQHGGSDQTLTFPWYPRPGQHPPGSRVRLPRRRPAHSSTTRHPGHPSQPRAISGMTVLPAMARRSGRSTLAAGVRSCMLQVACR
jgi:hypothetical protein